MSRRLGMIDLREAARRAANSEHYSGKREPEAVRSWVKRLVRKIDDPALVSTEGRRTLIHPSVHAAFSEIPARDRVAVELLSCPQHKRNAALAKLRALRAFEVYQRGPGRALGKSAARMKFVYEHQQAFTYRNGDKTRTLKLSVRSLSSWESKYAAGGVDALARDGRGRPVGDDLDDQAVSLYWRFRNDPRKFSLAYCHRGVACEARRHGWRWHRTYSACAAWDKRTRNDRALSLNREGDQRYTQTTSRYIELDPESYAPGECYVGDDHELNVWVKMPNGKIARPTLSAWQDWRSRVVVGYRIVLVGNEHSILLAFSDGAERHGLPETVIADNGKNYTSHLWTGGKPRRRTYRQAGDLAEQAEGVFALCGITPSWCIPYNPNGKARLERWFGTLDDQFCKSFPSYCGKSPDDRPEAHAKIVKRAVPFDEFVTAFRRYVDIYNGAPHSGEGMEGRSPLQVMAMAPRKRVLSDDHRPLLLAAWHKPVSISRNGVALRVCGASVRYGAGERALLELPIGTKVRVAYDPEDVSSVTVWTEDYRFLCTAAENHRLNRKLPAETLRETMREIAREKRALRQSRKVGLAHLRNPVDRSLAALSQDAAQRRLPDPPEGPPALVPVQSPLEPPPKIAAVPSQAVDAETGETVGEDTDALSRFEAFARVPEQDAEPIHVALERWSERQGRE